jgi:hypothetical protein
MENDTTLAKPPGLVVGMTDEQLRYLLTNTTGTGLGAARDPSLPFFKHHPREFGLGKDRLAEVGDKAAPRTLGAPYECQVDPSIAADVYMFLRMGSPRLGLARAWGVPLAPYCVNVRGTFATTGMTYIPNLSNDSKIVQDTYVDCLTARIANLSSTANQSTFQTLSDFFYNFQNGIDATLDIQGAPRYSIAYRATPISNLADMVNGGSRWGNGWVLTYQQQIAMTYAANVALPTAPLDLTFTFRSWVPTNDMFMQMTSREAVQRLRDDGFWVPDWYLQNVCR